MKTLYLSVDPYMKFRMMGEPAFLSPWKVGEACIGGGAGVVLASKFSGLSEQDLVESFDFQWKTTFKIDGKLLNKVRSDNLLEFNFELYCYNRARGQRTPSPLQNRNMGPMVKLQCRGIPIALSSVF